MTSAKSLQVVRIRWRIQKNRKNGEVIHLTRDDDIPQLCPVQAAFSIVSRANKLGQKLDLTVGILLDEDQQEFHRQKKDALGLYQRSRHMPLQSILQ